ncbi:MAG: hypothetical protein EOO90_05230 [Pedobacter sp.]|nr:MAG: hypothetical protein EOO90_05230 [Pedobacter sp.]
MQSLSTLFNLTTLDLFKLFLPPLLSALVAFMLFAMTSRRDRRKDDKRRKLEREQRAKYLLELISSSSRLTNHQWKLLDAYINEVKASPFNSHTLMLTPIFSLERLFNLIGDELSFISLTTIDDSNKSNKLIGYYTELTVSIDYLHGIKTNIMEAVKERFSNKQLEGNKYYESINTLAEDISTLLIELQVLQMSASEQMFLKESIALQETLNAQPSRDIEEHFKYFLVPFISLCYNCSNETFTKIDALSRLVKQAKNLENSRSQMLATIKHHVDLMEHSSANFKKAIAHLSDKYTLLKENLK